MTILMYEPQMPPLQILATCLKLKEYSWREHETGQSRMTSAAARISAAGPKMKRQLAVNQWRLRGGQMLQLGEQNVLERAVFLVAHPVRHRSKNVLDTPRLNYQRFLPGLSQIIAAYTMHPHHQLPSMVGMVVPCGNLVQQRMRLHPLAEAQPVYPAEVYSENL